MTYRLRHPGGPLRGKIELTSSKSIANRALIIQALTPGGFPLERLATADDTVRLQRILQLVSAADTSSVSKGISTSEVASPESENRNAPVLDTPVLDTPVLDAGPAGTTFRFLTAYLSRQPGTQVLTGSERMKERPIGILVDALRHLGARIDYLEKDGYPPLRIGESSLAANHELCISASTSSQFISALLLLAPTLPRGLRLTLAGKIVSRPYIQMTLSLMAYFGVEHRWEEQTIIVEPQAYRGRPYVVEADWSAASYYYSLAAIAPAADLHLGGLYAQSVQGDAVIQEFYRRFGVETSFTEFGLRLQKAPEQTPPELFEYDFLACPDVAQTVAVTCGALGTKGLFTGLETLKIKETDRVAALKNELKKVEVFLSELPARFSPRSGRDYVMQEGKATLPQPPPRFATYHDHRMAMALAPLGLRGEIEIEDPLVVGKSYPEFYEHLQKIGFAIEKVE